MDKHSLLIHLHAARAELTRALLGVSTETFETAIVLGEWRWHDVLAHIAAWGRWTCDAIRALRAGQPVAVDPSLVSDQAFNAQAVALRRDWPLTQLLDEFEVAHRQLIVIVAGASAEQLTRRYFIGTEPYTITDLARSIIDHDREHAAQINQWQQSRGYPDSVGPKPILQVALNTNRAALLTLIDHVPAGTRATQAVEGEWTVQDVCGHIADWDELFLEAVLAMERHERITWRPGDYGEGWNQTHAQARRAQPWERVWQDFLDRRGTLMTELQERISEADFPRTLPDPWGGEVTFYRWLTIPCEHDAMHAASLLAWLEESPPEKRAILPPRC